MNERSQLEVMEVILIRERILKKNITGSLPFIKTPTGFSSVTCESCF